MTNSAATDHVSSTNPTKPLLASQSLSPEVEQAIIDSKCGPGLWQNIDSKCGPGLWQNPVVVLESKSWLSTARVLVSAAFIAVSAVMLTCTALLAMPGYLFTSFTTPIYINSAYVATRLFVVDSLEYIASIRASFLVVAFLLLFLPYTRAHISADSGGLLPTLEYAKLGNASTSTPWTSGTDLLHFDATVDSGATSTSFPEALVEILKKLGLVEVIDANPHINLVVASDQPLEVKEVVRVKAQVKCFTLSNTTTGNTSDFITMPNSTKAYKVDGVCEPILNRVLSVDGLASPLLGVRPMRSLDGIFTLLNSLNPWGISDVLVLPSVVKQTTTSGSRNEPIFVPFKPHPKAFLVQFHTGLTPTCNLETERLAESVCKAATEGLDLHCALGHGSSQRLKHANITGVNLSSIPYDTSNCRGCRLGKAKNRPFSKQKGPRDITDDGIKITKFGQRVDSDIQGPFPVSWPHRLQYKHNFVDVASRLYDVSFLVGPPNQLEVLSSLNKYVADKKRSYPGYEMHTWHTDNATYYRGQNLNDAASSLIQKHSHSVANQSNTNPIAERNLGVGAEMSRAALHQSEGIPECLWTWSERHAKIMHKFLPTKGHTPPLSPYDWLRSSNPNSLPANLSWAKPLFCDCSVVAVAKTDISGKTGARAYDACYLGYDENRSAFICWVRALKRISSFIAVSSWRPQNFTECKFITADMPVEYTDDNDLAFSPVTRDAIQSKFSKNKSAAIPLPLTRPPVAAPFQIPIAYRTLPTARQLVHESREQLFSSSSSYTEPLIAHVTETHKQQVDDLLHNGVASIDILHYNPSGEPTDQIYAIDSVTLQPDDLNARLTVKQAMMRPDWPIIREAMEEEIAGKMLAGRESWTVVPRPNHGHVMKSRWVITIVYNADGTIKKVKCRFVGCGYSQIKNVDYDEVFAGTLRNVCYRNVCAIITAEDLETDEFDAIKAFTQAKVDKQLYVEMPQGFTIVGMVLLLIRALEGIKQGANLFAKLNTSTWTDPDKCGMNSSDIEPHLYSHPDKNVRILVIAFADNHLGAYAKKDEAKYIQIKSVYQRYVTIDNVGLHPVSQFLGVQMVRDRALKTMTLCQSGYIKRVSNRRAEKFDKHSCPVGNSKTDRETFSKLAPAKTDDERCDKSEYLGVLGEYGWVTGMTRPDQAFYFVKLASLTHAPTKLALKFLYRAYGHMVYSCELGLTYGGPLRVPMGLGSMPVHYVASSGSHQYSDSSWGGPRPFGGYVTMYYGGAVNWSAFSLKIEPDSSAEAETAVSSKASKDGRFHRLFMEDAGCPVSGPTPLLVDNKALTDLVNKPGASARTRYFERATRFVKYAVQKLMILLFLIGTKFMVADVFTKPLEKDLYYKFRDYMLNTHACPHSALHVRTKRSIINQFLSRLSVY